MKLQGLTSKAGVNVKQMSKTVKRTTLYPFSFSLSCFPLYQYAARPITEPYHTAKKGTYRFIDKSTQPYCVPPYFGLAYCEPPFFGLAYCVPFNNKTTIFSRFHLHKEDKMTVCCLHVYNHSCKC